MKRLTVILCVLALLGLAVWAHARMGMQIVAGSHPAAAGGPTEVAADNFNSDTSANWAMGDGYSYAFQIYNGYVNSLSGSWNICSWYYSAASFNDDQYSEAKYQDNIYLGPAVRISTSGGVAKGYVGMITGATNVRVNKITDSTTASTLGNCTVSSLAVGDLVRITAAGGATTTLKVYVKGSSTESCTITDSSSAITTGKPGVIANSGTAYLNLDDWAGGNL